MCWNVLVLHSVHLVAKYSPCEDEDTWEKATVGGREPGWSTGPSKQGHSHQQAGSLMATTSEDCGLQTVMKTHSIKIIKPLQLVAGKLMMKFQVSLPSIYSLYLRRICCIYKGGDQMIKPNRLFPSLRLLWSLSTHKIEAWFGSPKYLVCHVSFSSKWT